MTSAFDSILQHPAIWRGGDCARVAVPGVPTGYAELDALLPGASWPGGALTEILVERPGIGELQLVVPAMARLTQAGHWLAVIAPPYIPYAPALAAHGVRLSQLILLQPRSVDEQLWSCEEALRSNGCGAVLIWLDRVQERALRRLQLAAGRSEVLAMLFRPVRSISFSPAALRLHIGKTGSRTVVRILKRRGSGVPAPVMLDLHGAIAGRPTASRHAAAAHARHPATAY